MNLKRKWIEDLMGLFILELTKEIIKKLPLKLLIKLEFKNWARKDIL